MPPVIATQGRIPRERDHHRSTALGAKCIRVYNVSTFVLYMCGGELVCVSERECVCVCECGVWCFFVPMCLPRFYRERRERESTWLLYYPADRHFFHDHMACRRSKGGRAKKKPPKPAQAYSPFAGSLRIRASRGRSGGQNMRVSRLMRAKADTTAWIRAIENSILSILPR